MNPIDHALASLIDHTLLKPESSRANIEKICAEAREFQFAAVCVLPLWLSLVAEELRGTPVKPCTVVGFPLGGCITEAKACETHHAIRAGAREIDMVLALPALKDKRYKAVAGDIAAVVRLAGPDCPVKVILETCLLTDEEKRTACKIAVDAGARFVKTSTGLSSGGATVRDVRLMRLAVGDHIGVKASGGIRTLEQARALIAAGANRLGTSAGVGICREPAAKLTET